MDLRRLEYFLAVVDHGGVTAAAVALHLAQPSLSQTIRGLEKDLGVQLFDRRGRRMDLSAAGRALVEPARRALSDLAVARAAVDEVVELTAGWLDIAVHDLLGVNPLVGVLAAFHRRHPGVPVRVHGPRDEDEMIRMVIDGGCELAMTYLPVQHGGLWVRRLGTQETWVVLPPDTPAGPDPLPVGVLDGLPVVQGTDGFEAASAAVRSALRAAGVRMRTAVVSRHSEAILPLVLAGAGVAFTTERHARQAADAGAVIRRLDPAITVPYAVLHRKASLSPAAQGFLDTLLTELRAAGGD